MRSLPNNSRPRAKPEVYYYSVVTDPECSNLYRQFTGVLYLCICNRVSSESFNRKFTLQALVLLCKPMNLIISATLRAGVGPGV